MIRVFIGHDHCEELAYHVCASSIMRHATVPVSITPIKSDHLRGLYNRDRDPKQSNEFSFSRFLVPYLCNYEGWAIFMDCDMVVRCDIKELWELRNTEYAVQVCKHDYIPKDTKKYLGNIQHAYPRKNWSSMMLMNTAQCRKLTPEYVQTASGLDLHRFRWTQDDLIGDLPLRYNWLVGEYPANPDAAIYHYTVGGPWFTSYRDTDHALEWEEELFYMTNVKGEQIAQTLDLSRAGEGI